MSSGANTNILGVSDELSLQLTRDILIDNLSSLESGDEWLAIKTDLTSTIKKDLVNIVSLSVELEKIIIVTREHNRLASDENNTNKQWFGIFTVEQLYLIHQQIIQIDPELDKLYPIELKPIKGYLSTYFTNDLTQSINPGDCGDIDLQDNYLCNSISDYLKKACESIGINLFVDILFNDLSNNDYFEVYSEFNLKRLQNEIEKLKSKLTDVMSNQFTSSTNSNSKNKKLNLPFLKKSPEEIKEESLREFKRNLSNILNRYSEEDQIVKKLLKVYAEYYNNLLKPLVDSRELSNANLSKYERKLANQIKQCKYLTDQSATDALNQLKDTVVKAKSDIFELSNDIDQLCIQYKKNIIETNQTLLDSIKKDKQKFILPKNNSYIHFFEIVTKPRTERIEEEITNKKLQMFNIHLKLYERNKDNLTDKEVDKLKLKELDIKIIKLKLEINNQEESIQKKILNKLKEDFNGPTKNVQLEELARDLGCEYLNDLKLKFNVDVLFILKENASKEQELFQKDENSDDEDESNFFDTHEDPQSILDEEAKEKQIKINEIKLIKNKILEISSNKSSLRLTLNKLNEVEKPVKEVVVEPQPVIKSISTRKEEDRIQKELCMENRNRALQRLKEYKLKQSKSFSSTDSLASIKSTSTTTNLTIKSTPKKPYVPKSKQRILPPKFNQPKASNNPSKNSNSISFEIKFDPIESSMNDTIKITPDIPPPPPPPLTQSLFSPPPPLPVLQSLIPPPPPPPPIFQQKTTSAPPPAPPPSLSTSEIKLKPTNKENQPNNLIKSTMIEFDLNEIKNFKFKKSASKRSERDLPKPKAQFNSWENLMNDIKSNARRNLRNVNRDSPESSNNKKTKLNSDHHSKLEWDLNSILSERSKYFISNDDDNDEEDENDDWSDSTWSTNKEY